MLTGGYYFNPYRNRNLTIYSKDDKSTLTRMTALESMSFIENNIIDIKKFYKFIKDYRAKTYDEIIELLARYYNPYYNLDKFSDDTTIIDYKGKKIKGPTVTNIGKIYKLSELLELDKENLNMDNEWNTKIDIINKLSNDLIVKYNKIPYKLLINKYDRRNPIKEIDKQFIIDASLLASKKFINFIRKFNTMCPNIDYVINILYNGLDEPTKKPNPIKTMYNTGTIKYFYELLRMIDIDNLDINSIHNALNQKHDFANMGNILNNPKNMDDLDNIQKLFTNAHISNISQIIHNIIRKDSIRIVNAISFETVKTKFNELTEKTLFILIKNLIQEIINENSNIITIYTDKKKNQEPTFQVMYNFILQTLIREQKIVINKNNKLDMKKFKGKYDMLIKYINLLKKKYLFGNVYDKIHNSSLPKYTDIVSKFLQIYNIIFDLVNGNEEENEKIYSNFIQQIDIDRSENEFINVSAIYVKIIEYYNAQLNNLLNNDNEILNIVNDFYTLQCKFIIPETNKPVINYCNDVIELILRKIHVIRKNNDLNELTQYLVTRGASIDVEDIIDNLESNIEVISKNIGTVGAKNKFEIILNSINNELSDNIPRIKYYYIFMLELIEIIYHVKKISEFFASPNAFNLGSIITYIYFIDLYKTDPLFVSKDTIIENMFFEPNVPHNGQPSYYSNKYTYINDQIAQYLDYSYKSVGYESVFNVIPDCMESTTRDFINVMILNDEIKNIDTSKLPKTTHPDILAFYNKYKSLDQHYDNSIIRQDWIKIFNTTIKNELKNRYPNYEFYHTNRSHQFQDIKSNFFNFTNVLMIIFGFNGTIIGETESKQKEECKGKMEEIMKLFYKNGTINFEYLGGSLKMMVSIGDLTFEIRYGHSLMSSSGLGRMDLSTIIDNQLFNKLPYSYTQSFYSNEYYNFNQFIISENPNHVTNFSVLQFLYRFIESEKTNNLDPYLQQIGESQSAFVRKIESIIINEKFGEKIIEVLDRFKCLGNYVYFLISSPSFNEKKKNTQILLKINNVVDHIINSNVEAYFNLEIDNLLLFVKELMNKLPDEDKFKLIKYIIKTHSDKIGLLLDVFTFKLQNEIYLLFEILSIYNFETSPVIDIIKLFYIRSNDLYLNMTDNELYDSILNNVLILSNNKTIKFACDNCVKLIKGMKEINNKSMMNNKDILYAFTKLLQYSFKPSDGIFDLVKIVQVFISKNVPVNFYIMLCHINYKIPTNINNMSFVIRITELLNILSNTKQNEISKQKQISEYIKEYSKLLDRIILYRITSDRQKIIINEQQGGVYNNYYKQKYQKYKSKYLKLKN
jgi:hypothetical protein